jgi:hypothetical protein
VNNVLPFHLSAVPEFGTIFKMPVFMIGFHTMFVARLYNYRKLVARLWCVISSRKIAKYANEQENNIE